MKYFIASAVFILLFYIINRITLQRLSARYTERLLSSTEANEALPAQLLYSTMRRSRVFTELSLPIPSKEGEEICIGTVAVNRSGVYIICQIHGDGIIDNPNGQTWKHICDGSCNEFENPFRTQEGARNLIEYYAKNSGLGAVKAHSLLVCTNPSLRFTHTLSRSIVSAESLCRKLSALDRHGRLTYSEVRRICKVLSDINGGIYP